MRILFDKKIMEERTLHNIRAEANGDKFDVVADYNGEPTELKSEFSSEADAIAYIQDLGQRMIAHDRIDILDGR